MANSSEKNTGIILQRKELNKGRTTKLKYHTFFFILSLVVFLLLFMLLKYGPEILPFAMFILFFSIPLFLLFTSQLKEIIPSRLVSLLTEDVEDVKETKRTAGFFSAEGRMSARNQQYVYIFFLIVIGIGLIQLLRTLMGEVDPMSSVKDTRKTTVKMIVGVILTVFACVLTLNFYYISDPSADVMSKKQ